MIHHHPSEATLIAHAAGHLPVLHSRVLEVHLSQCQSCRAELHRMEEVGGALLASLPPANLRPDALPRALAGLDDEVPAAPTHTVPTTLDALTTGRWWWLGPGIRLMPLVRRDASGTRLDLIRVAPGVALPGHGHTGPEMACILQGAYSDETGEYGPYDVAEGDVMLAHTPVAAPGADCICLIATTGRLRAHTWAARLVQPLLGI